MFGNLSIIIDFAIVDGYMASTRAGKWLVGSRIQIDDTQALVNQQYVVEANYTLIIRTSVAH